MNASALQFEGPVDFVLLAAGRGQRFGPGKLTADLVGRPVWRWAVGGAIDAGVAAIHVVTNDPAVGMECTAHGWAVIANPDAESGIASSIRAAAGVAQPDRRLVIALADMPFVGSTHLRALASGEEPAFTHYPGGRRGVPAAFSFADSRRLLSLNGDKGAASLEWPAAVAIDPPEADTLMDIDTPAALERARAVALRRRPAACR